MNDLGCLRSLYGAIVTMLSKADYINADEEKGEISMSLFGMNDMDNVDRSMVSPQYVFGCVFSDFL